jgi:hypothetical protein
LDPLAPPWASGFDPQSSLRRSFTFFQGQHLNLALLILDFGLKGSERQQMPIAAAISWRKKAIFTTKSQSHKEKHRGLLGCHGSIREIGAIRGCLFLAVFVPYW